MPQKLKRYKPACCIRKKLLILFLISLFCRCQKLFSVCKLPITLLLLLAFSFKVTAGNTTAKDSNIVISNCKEVYEFVYDKSSNSVQVKESLSTTYHCNDFRSSL